jgi:hypothetical protein
LQRCHGMKGQRNASPQCLPLELELASREVGRSPQRAGHSTILLGMDLAAGSENRNMTGIVDLW